MNIRRPVELSMDYLVVAIVLVGVLSPFVYVAFSSFKPLKEIMTVRPAFFPHQPTLKNYQTLLLARTPIRNFPLFLYNSFKVSLGTALFTLVLACLGGYGLARYRYPGKELLARMMLFIYVFPTILLLIPVYKMFSHFNLLDTHFALIIVYTALAAPFCTWLLNSFFRGIPAELEEAAMVDGARGLTIFFSDRLSSGSSWYPDCRSVCIYNCLGGVYVCPGSFNDQCSKNRPLRSGYIHGGTVY